MYNILELNIKSHNISTVMAHLDRYALESEPLIIIALRTVFKNPKLALPGIATLAVSSLIHNALNSFLTFPLELFIGSLGVAAIVILAFRVLGLGLVRGREDAVGRLLSIGVVYLLVEVLTMVVVATFLTIEIVILMFLAMIVGFIVVIIAVILVPITVVVLMLAIAFPLVTVYEYFTEPERTFGEALREAFLIVKGNAGSLSLVVVAYIVLNAVALILEWAWEKIPPAPYQNLLISAAFNVNISSVVGLPVVYVLIAGALSIPLLLLGSLLVYLREKPYKLPGAPKPGEEDFWSREDLWERLDESTLALRSPLTRPSR